MNAAQFVVQKFGGQSALAALLGKRQSTIQHWTKTGIVPAKWHAQLLSLAQDRGIDLGPSDLISSGPSKDVGEVAPRKPPEAKWFGTLSLGNGLEVPCFVLSDGRRVISRSGVTKVLTEGKGGGNLESYIYVEAIKKYLPSDLPDQMIEFSIDIVVNREVHGFEAETFLEICRAYVKARDEGALKSERQIEIAIQAGMFLSACAKVGLIALIDEATGYQYERAADALRFKLKVYLEDEMRKWEKTFPDELWREFARLTRYTQVSITQRPKWWGKLVMELVYDYLDKDVADWLRKNAPKPRHGENYHQWLSSQYGLKKLTEHLWMLIGMASACDSLRDLRERMAARFGRYPVQMTFYLPMDDNSTRGLPRPDSSD